jgi:hypothetical protein
MKISVNHAHAKAGCQIITFVTLHSIVKNSLTNGNQISRQSV